MLHCFSVLQLCMLLPQAHSSGWHCAEKVVRSEAAYCIRPTASIKGALLGLLALLVYHLQQLLLLPVVGTANLLVQVWLWTWNGISTRLWQASGEQSLLLGRRWLPAPSGACRVRILSQILCISLVCLSSSVVFAAACMLSPIWLSGSLSFSQPQQHTRSCTISFTFSAAQRCVAVSVRMLYLVLHARCVNVEERVSMVFRAGTGHRSSKHAPVSACCV